MSKDNTSSYFDATMSAALIYDDADDLHVFQKRAWKYAVREGSVGYFSGSGVWFDFRGSWTWRIDRYHELCAIGILTAFNKGLRILPATGLLGDAHE